MNIDHNITQILIRPILTYSSTVWYGTNKTNYKDLKIEFYESWLTHLGSWETRKFTERPRHLHDFITTPTNFTIGFHLRQNWDYNLGHKTLNSRLKLGLSPDIIDFHLDNWYLNKKKEEKPAWAEPIKCFVSLFVCMNIYQVISQSSASLMVVLSGYV